MINMTDDPFDFFLANEDDFDIARVSCYLNYKSLDILVEYLIEFKIDPIEINNIIKKHLEKEEISILCTIEVMEEFRELGFGNKILNKFLELNTSNNILLVVASSEATLSY